MTTYLTIARPATAEVEDRGSRFLCTLRRSLLTELALDLDHAVAGRVEGELRSRGVTVLDVAYDARVRMLLAAAPPEVDRVREVVAAATGGRSAPEPVGERWVDAPT